MDFEEFKEQFAEDVKNDLEGKGIDASVKVNSVEKMNENYDALTDYEQMKDSSTLANTIIILSQIRNKPFVTTKELAEKLELSERTIQRYIETLRVAGEWIEYDTSRKGWRLCDGKSILWGDV